MAHPVGTKVLTPQGWREIETLMEGDRLLGPDGESRTVSLLKSLGRLPIWSVELTDQVTVQCSEGHLWPVRTSMQTHRGRGYKAYPLHDLWDNLREGEGYRWFIPMLPAPLVFPDETNDLPLDAYVMGVWLGDGSSRSSCPSLSNDDPEILNVFASLLPAGLKLVPRERSDYNISGGYRGGAPNPFSEALRTLELWYLKSEDKFIPQVYAHCQPEERVRLVRGLCDTDGSGRDGTSFVEYSTSSPRLAGGMRYVVESLGGTARTKRRKTFYTHKGEKREGLPNYRILVRLPGGLCPFLTSRKTCLHLSDTPYTPKRAIKSVESVGLKETLLLGVDGPDDFYLTEHFVIAQGARP